MELNMKISIIKALSNDAGLAAGLKKGSKTISESIQQLADKTKSTYSFIEMNIDLIRNWID